MRPLCSEKPVAVTMTMSVRESQMLEMQLSASGANGGCDIPYLKVLARDHDDSWEFPHSRFGQAMRRCLAISIGTSVHARQCCVCESNETMQSLQIIQECSCCYRDCKIKCSSAEKKRLYGEVPKRLIMTLHI